MSARPDLRPAKTPVGQPSHSVAARRADLKRRLPMNANPRCRLHASRNGVWIKLSHAQTPLLSPVREQLRDAYGGNGARLTALKRRFDTDGVFASTIPLPDEH